MQKFYRLQHRKQISLVMALAVLVIAVFFLLVWIPVNENLGQQQSRFDSAARTLQSIESTAARIALLQTQGSTSNTGLTTLVNESLQSRELEFTRLQQLSVDQVQIRLDSVAFGDVLAWIYDIENTPGIVVSELSARMASSNQPGLVNVTAGLSRVE